MIGRTILALLLASGCSGSSSSSSPPHEPRGPGQEEWELVPKERVAEECRLDPELLELADAEIGRAYGIVRYGKLCHEYYPEDLYPEGDEIEIVFSAAKTLAGVLVGIASWETRDIERSGRKTGPLLDSDRVDHWLDSFTFNQDAQVGHVLGMVGLNEDLSAPDISFTYDAVGVDQINRLNDVVTLAIAQDPSLGSSVHEFLEGYVFDALGMRDSAWEGDKPDKNFALGWESTVRDMARVGLLMLDGGVWDGERLMSEDYAYKMTHPSFEYANTGYAYLTWLIARSNADDGDGTPKTTEPNAECTPSAIWNEFPHGLSTSPDCNYIAPYDCQQSFDVGVWYAAGLMGNYISGHPGLDMLLVVKNIGSNNQQKVWQAVRPALVALDPSYEGDEEAFCEAYAASGYAPDLR